MRKEEIYDIKKEKREKSDNNITFNRDKNNFAHIIYTNKINNSHYMPKSIKSQFCKNDKNKQKIKFAYN